VKPVKYITAVAHQEEHFLSPYWAEVKDITPETEGVSTYWLEFADKEVRQSYTFASGQFNMLYLPMYGEAAISISSDPEKPELIGHTIRFVGNVTNAASHMNIGQQMGVRGPFGTAWPIQTCKGQDIVIATGGIGLAPLRPVIYEIMNQRDDYAKVTLLYGARSPKDLLFVDQYKEWENKGIEVLVTVDRADETWNGLVGVVPMMFYHLRLDKNNTAVFSCGPEIMMHFVVYEVLARRIPPQKIFLSLERNMKCGQGFCGHCQYGPYFICKDGPVFSFDKLEPFFSLEDL
jgi:NAD(P)H-flavin reductase